MFLTDSCFCQYLIQIGWLFGTYSNTVELINRYTHIHIQDVLQQTWFLQPLVDSSKGKSVFLLLFDGTEVKSFGS